MATRGPKTQAGKRVASRNSLKHGLASEANVIPGMEREEEWEAHRDGIFESLNPEGHFQEVLADRIANLTWRLDRVKRYEIAVIARQVEGTVDDLAIADAYLAGTLSKGDLPDVDAERVHEAQQTRVVPAPRQLEQIMRYEAHLHRQCIQTLHELEALQARRKGLPAHLARLDISLPPAS